MRIFLPILFCLAALPAGAQQFYSWRDANGVRHYSQSPPPHDNYQERMVREPRKPPAAAEPAKASSNPACTRARANIAVFANNDSVSMDRDGDGKAEVLSDAQRAAELDRAMAVSKTACSR